MAEFHWKIALEWTLNELLSINWPNQLMSGNLRPQTLGGTCLIESRASSQVKLTSIQRLERRPGNWQTSEKSALNGRQASCVTSNQFGTFSSSTAQRKAENELSSQFVSPGNYALCEVKTPKSSEAKWREFDRTLLIEFKFKFVQNDAVSPRKLLIESLHLSFPLNMEMMPETPSNYFFFFLVAVVCLKRPEFASFACAPCARETSGACQCKWTRYLAICITQANSIIFSTKSSDI